MANQYIMQYLIQGIFNENPCFFVKNNQFPVILPTENQAF